MTRAEFNLFLLASAGLCLLMAIVNLARYRKRGTSAYLLAGAFLAVGFALLLYRSDAETWTVIGLGVVAFLLLAGDLAIRSRDSQLPGGGK